MQTYRCFMSIIKKNKGTLILYFVIFGVLLLILTNSNQSTSSQMYKDEQIPFTVINRDNSELGKSITKMLSKNNKFVNLEDDISVLQQQMFYRKIYYALIIPEGYEEAVKSGEDMTLLNYKVKDSSMGYYLDLKVSNYIKTIKSYMASGLSLEDAVSKSDKTVEKTIDVNVKKQKNVVSYSGDFYYYMVIPYIFMALIISAIGPVYIAFGKKGIRNRIASSSLTIKSQNLQFVLGAATVSGLILVIFNVLAYILYHEHITPEKMLLYFLNTLCFIMISIGLTILIGNIATSDAILASMVNVVALGTSFLGGVFVPIEVFGSTMKNVAKYMPTYWYISGVNDIVKVDTLTGDIVKKIFASMGVQLLYAVAFMCVAAAIIRRKRINGAVK